MSEQLNGVEHFDPDEEFDPDVALYLIADQVTETCDELWNARLAEAAFGSYSALSGESPADESEYERAALDLVKDFVSEQLSQFKRQGLVPLIFDPEKQEWYPINGVGFNTELLSLVALVHDPEDPTSTVTKLLGPGTDLAYIEPTTEFEPMPYGESDVAPIPSHPGVLTQPFQPIPFTSNFDFTQRPNDLPDGQELALPSKA